jgi:preprotein translocase subunit SecG
MAFGGAAADALFGAGSGNFLTQTTRYSTIALVVIALGLGYVDDRLHNLNSGSEFEKAVQQAQSQMPATTPAPVGPSSSPVTMPTNSLLEQPVTTPASTPAPPPVSAPVAPSNAPTAPTQAK